MVGKGSVKWKSGHLKLTGLPTLCRSATVKSDDVIGRVKTYEAIVKGDNIPEPGVPESFKVLVKEMQSLGLNVKVLSEEAGEIYIREDEEDDDYLLDVNMEGLEEEDEEEETPTEKPQEVPDKEEPLEKVSLELKDGNPLEVESGKAINSKMNRRFGVEKDEDELF